MAGTKWQQSVRIAGAIVASASFLFGCASKAPPPSDPTTKEIRSDSDRMFDKMKQEERERAQDKGAY
jgi:hypothetical protein